MTETAVTTASSRNAIQRWRSPLIVVTLTGLLVALLSGSVLLFFPLAPAAREYWVLVHWVLAAAVLLPYALYQIRHYLRVRVQVQQTHYRVGLHAFFLVCGAVLTGLLLIVPLRSGTTPYSVVDLAHIFFSFAFSLLLSAHLTLVSLRAVSLAVPADTDRTRASIRLLLGVSGVLAVAAIGLAVWLA
jgi:hypothetical protein